MKAASVQVEKDAITATKKTHTMVKRSKRHKKPKRSIGVGSLCIDDTVEISRHQTTLVSVASGGTATKRFTTSTSMTKKTLKISTDHKRYLSAEEEEDK